MDIASVKPVQLTNQLLGENPGFSIAQQYSKQYTDQYTILFISNDKSDAAKTK